MRVLCTETTRVEVAPKTFADLDAHHEYYLEDALAADLIARGRAYELDAQGRRVKARPKSAPAKKTAARKPPAKKATGPARKPGAVRSTKAVEAAPENKAAPDAEPGPADEEKA